MRESLRERLGGKTRRRLSLGLVYLITWFFCVVIGYPVLWMVFQSLKTRQEMYQNIWGLPQSWEFANYIEAWNLSNIGIYIWNSLFVAVAAVILVVVVCSLASYAFAYLSFRGRLLLFFIFVMSLMLPLPIIPLYAVVSNLGLVNTRLGLILPYAGQSMPLAIFLLTTFYQGIGSEITDAARVDGCSEFGIYSRIIMPIAKPGLATVVIFAFMNAWNEFFLALVIARRRSVRTIPVGLEAFFSEYTVNWSALFAALSIAIVPVVIVYVLMQRQFIKALTAGAVKG